MKSHSFVLSGCWCRSHSLEFVFESLRGSEGQFCTFLSSSPRSRLGFGPGAGTGAGGAFQALGSRCCPLLCAEGSRALNVMAQDCSPLVMSLGPGKALV